MGPLAALQPLDGIQGHTRTFSQLPLVNILTQAQITQMLSEFRFQFLCRMSHIR